LVLDEILLLISIFAASMHCTLLHRDAAV